MSLDMADEEDGKDSYFLEMLSPRIRRNQGFNRFHQNLDSVRGHIGKDAVAEVENEASISPHFFQKFLTLASYDVRRTVKDVGVEIALQGDGFGHLLSNARQIAAPVKAYGLRTQVDQIRNESGRSLAEKNNGNVGCLDNSVNVGKGKLPKLRKRQGIGPGFKNLKSVDARFGLHFEIIDRNRRDQVEKLVKGFGVLKNPFFYLFNSPRHVAGYGERGSAKSEQRNSKQGFDKPYRLADKIKRIDDRKTGNIGRGQRLFKDGADPLVKIKGASERIGYRQNIGKNDRCIHAELFDRHHGYLGGDFRPADHLLERKLFAKSSVLGHVTARLSHDPNRGPAMISAVERVEKKSVIHGYRMRSRTASTVYPNSS